MRDFEGKELKVGDEVICINTYGKYLIRGYVHKVTPKGATIITEHDEERIQDCIDFCGEKPKRLGTPRRSNQIMFISREEETNV
jgi:hypothetical protein